MFYCIFSFVVFFFKQKTAYEMRISDWSSDVCSSDLQFAIGGQVILSSPGGPCLWCLGVLTDARLEQEAQKYGAAGGKPQVVWPNGVLASLAVGLVMQLLLPWMREPVASVYLEYVAIGRAHV